MTNTPHFSFNRTLSPEELNFWSTFFDYFPCHHTRYFQSAINIFSKQISGKFQDKLDLDFLYQKVKACNTNQEMFDFLNQQDLNDNAKHAFKKIIADFTKIIPNAKPVELFLLSIYSGNIQDWNLELQPNGINLSSIKGQDIERKTFVTELAMVTDLMAGRLIEIVPSLNFEPIVTSGKQGIINSNNEKYIIFVEPNKNNAYFSNDGASMLAGRIKISNEKEHELEFAFDYSKNSNEQKNIYAPLAQEQNNLINIIRKNYLDNVLSTQEVRYNIKRKI